MLQELAPVFAGRKPDVAEENVQARLRGVTLMALSNKFGSMVLTTGNKSELAVGYCTLYGDMCGGLAVISDVPKTLVYTLSRIANRRLKNIIPENVFSKPPSAELRLTRRTAIPSRNTKSWIRSWKPTSSRIITQGDRVELAASA